VSALTSPDTADSELATAHGPHRRSIVGTLPATSEKLFSSGAPRFLVADRQFAYMKPDLRTLVLRVAVEDWEALLTATDAALLPQPRAYLRQRGLFATLNLAIASKELLTEVLTDAWLTCAPREIVQMWHGTASH
jgi:hypothetical protein